jgi:MATE family multidrug resistance protein
MGSLLRLSIQNMLTLVSVNLMLFLDRMVLARHSLESLDAAVAAGAICNIFIFGAIGIVGIGDVFIGQCYGAGRTKKIGEILWQMMWFCLSLALAFNLIAHFLTPYLFPLPSAKLSHIYFSSQMKVGFLPVVIAALTSFFVGTKRFGFALVAVIIASTIKLLLVIPLVFGIDGFFLGYGLKGAIMATTISHVVHIAILGFVVLKKSNRYRFGSLNWHFRPQLFIECMRLGFPQSVGSMLSYTAWGMVVNLLAAAGPKHLMMYTIMDSAYNLLCFATEGLQKSVLSMSANLIGSGRSSETSNIFKKALRLLLPILLVLSIPLLLFPTIVAKGLDITVLSSQQISLACFVIWLYFGFDGLSWILNGLLTAMGDTLFVNPVHGITSFVGVAATYIMTVANHCRPEITCWVSVIYGVISSMVLLMRYLSRKQDIPKISYPKERSSCSSLAPFYSTMQYK